jgi:methyl-accepting chemotaxis protein
VLGLLLAGAGPLLVLRRLKDLSASARGIFENAVGRVTYGDGHDVVAEARLAFAMQAAQLTALRGRLGDLTDSLANSAEEAQRTATDSHGAIAAQNEEIEQLAAAMNEMAATVQEVSRNTAQAADAVAEAEERTQAGEQTIERSSDVMAQLATKVDSASNAVEALGEETSSIRRVLDVIRGIAEQTNLLALNAAIEAARAGQSGRGFAVVADEVRGLAARVGESTTEIADMIESLEARAETAVAAMRSGRDTAAEVTQDAAASTQTITGIGEEMLRLRDMNTQIATAAEQQSAVAEDINRRLTKVSGNIQTTREGADRTRCNGDRLVEMVADLRDVIRQFRGAAA